MEGNKPAVQAQCLLFLSLPSKVWYLLLSSVPSEHIEEVRTSPGLSPGGVVMGCLAAKGGEHCSAQSWMPKLWEGK